MAKEEWLIDAENEIKDEAKHTLMRLNNLASDENVDMAYTLEVFLKELNKLIKNEKI